MSISLPTRRWPIGRLLLFAYLGVLSLSTIVRLTQPVREAPEQGQREIFVPTVIGDQLQNPQIRLAYYEYGDPTRPTLILLHGMPGSGSEFTKRDNKAGESPLEHFGQSYHVLAPDLPGLGNSTGSIPDYSCQAYARYTLALMDQLNIKHAHVLGLRQGGSVAIRLTEIAPERISGVILASGSGVQEYDLLGDHYLNKPLYYLQLSIFWLIQNGLPHFGRLDDFTITSAGRSLLESDLRPIRGALERFNGPMLIVHSRHDTREPVQLAIEHARLVPQSELLLLDNDSDGLDMTTIGDEMIPFLARADAGRATLRASADPQRIAAANVPFDPHVLPALTGYAYIGALTLVVLLCLLSESFACCVAGVLIAQGRIDPVTGVIGCLLGVLIGANLRFRLGYLLGRAGMASPPWVWLVHSDARDHASIWYNWSQLRSAMLARFFPLPRPSVDLALGAERRRIWHFGPSLLSAAIIWSVLVLLFASSAAALLLQVVRINSIAAQILVVSSATTVLYMVFALTLHAVMQRIPSWASTL